LLIANAMPTFITEAIVTRGAMAAVLNLFDISAVVWLAIAACLALLWTSGSEAQPERGDWAVTTVVVLIALIPFPALSAAGLTAAGVWGFLSAPKGSVARRASVIVLSLSTFFFWGRLFLALGGGPMLAADAQFLSWISGLSVSGNVVTATDSSTFVIAPGCSSLHGISVAVILWTTALAWFALPVTRRRVMLLSAMVAASVCVNGLRLALIGWYPADFDYWHIGEGAALIGWLSLGAMTAIVYTGLRYDIVKA
jgi:exosortase/archaeosortase family protein